MTCTCAPMTRRARLQLAALRLQAVVDRMRACCRELEAAQLLIRHGDPAGLDQVAVASREYRAQHAVARALIDEVRRLECH